MSSHPGQAFNCQFAFVCAYIYGTCRSAEASPALYLHSSMLSLFEIFQALLAVATCSCTRHTACFTVCSGSHGSIRFYFVLQILIEAIENVGRCQRSDHIKKAINYVKILLEKQAEPNARDEWGSGSALHYAIWCGQLEVVKLLLDTGTCNIEADTGTVLASYTLCMCCLGSAE